MRSSFVSATAGPWSDDVAAWVHHQTGGHALFVRELVVAVMSDSAQRPLGQFVAPVTVPAAVLDAIDAQLRALGRTAVHVLETVAVRGHACDRRDLEPLGRLVDAGVNEAVAAGVLLPVEEDGVVRFRHHLFRQAMLDRLSTGRTTELHDLAAQAIVSADEQRGRHVEFARHALAAASLDTERAIQALITSARIHDQHYAWEEAIESLTQALVLIDATVGRGDRWAAARGRDRPPSDAGR